MTRFPMTVLMTADAVGGVWDFALELAGGLAGQGVRTVLAGMGPPPSAAKRAKALATPGLELAWNEARLEWMDDARADVERAGEWLLSLERLHAPDLVHVNGYAHALLPWRAPCLVTAHSCVFSWWRAVKGEDPPAGYAAYGRDVARTLARRPVVFPTAALRAAMEAVHGPAPMGLVVFNGRDPAVFRPRPKELFVLGAGRIWDEAKNLTVLDRVAAVSPWPVYLAGDQGRPGDPSRPGGRLPGQARRLGQLPPSHMADWLGRAAVFVMPARYEPFGLAVLEAALACCVLVLGDIPSLRELWDGAALFAPPDDEAALARILAELADDPGEVARLGRLARRRGLDYPASAMAARYLDLYHSLTPRVRQPRPRSLSCASCSSPTR